MRAPKTELTNFWHYWRFVWQRVVEDRCGQMASALTLTTLFSLVPLLTVILTVLKTMPTFQTQTQDLINYILKHFLPSSAAAIQSYLQQFTAQAAEVTGIGSALLFVTAFILLANVQAALNTIWGVSSARRGWMALVLYWAILTLTPLIVVASIAVTSYFSILHLLLPAGFVTGPWIKIIGFFLSLFIFTILYITVPNAKVPFTHALAGATWAAIWFEIGRAAFRGYIFSFPNYKLLYGALATLPIFAFWIYLSWVFVLSGAEIAHALRYYDRKMAEKISPFLIVYRWFAFLWEAQHQGNGLTLMQLLQKQPLSSMHQAEHILEHLQLQGWVKQTLEGEYVLTRDMHEVSILDIYHNLNYTLPTTAELRTQIGNVEKTYPGDAALLEAVEKVEACMKNAALMTLAQCYK